MTPSRLYFSRSGAHLSESNMKINPFLFPETDQNTEPKVEKALFNPANWHDVSEKKSKILL